VLVISQVYGGGGNASAPYKNDYIEIYNRGRGHREPDPGGRCSTPRRPEPRGRPRHFRVRSFRAATTWSRRPRAPTRLPALPTPDANRHVAMNATTRQGRPRSRYGGAVGLVPERARDPRPGRLRCRQLLRGSPTPAISNTTADFRKGGGCTDTNDNLADFLIAGPAPRNSASPLQHLLGRAHRDHTTRLVCGTVAVVSEPAELSQRNTGAAHGVGEHLGRFHFVTGAGTPRVRAIR
jgi:hypothetical protein